MSKSNVSRPLLLALIACLASVAHRAQQGAAPHPVIVCDECKQVAVTPPPTPAATPAPDVASEWDLWTHGTLLRGANIWQKCLGDDHDPCESFETKYDDDDFKQLRAWGANYVNISHPGIYSEKPLKQNGRGPAAYRKVEKALDNLIELIKMCRRHGLFVVVSFRTGPGRNEAVFGGENKKPLTRLWETKRGSLTEDAARAQDAWVEMWREAAGALKDEPNVVGYELLVEPLQEPERKDGENKQDFWFALAERLAGAVRCVDGRTPILIGGANGSGACALSCLDTERFGRYGRVVYAAHQYHPYDEYTHQHNKYTKFECVNGEPLIVNPGRRDKHNPAAFGDWVMGEMHERYSYVYGFKLGRAVQVVVNEFGVVRYAGAPGAPDAARAVAYEMDLNERVGANHALWLWETRACITDDRMNFKRGTDPKHHVDLTPVGEARDALVGAVKANWGLNRVYATEAVLDKIAEERQPQPPAWLSCPGR